MRPIPSRLRLLAWHANSVAATSSQLYQALRSAATPPLLQRIGARSEEATESTPGMPFADDQYLAGQPANLADGMAITGALLAKLRDLARNLGAETWMVLVPGGTEVEDARWDSAEATFGEDRVQRDQPQRELSRLGEQTGIRVIDLLHAVRVRDARGERLYWKIDAHFNAAAHDETARVVAEALRQRVPSGTSDPMSQNAPSGSRSRIEGSIQISSISARAQGSALRNALPVCHFSRS